MGSEMCIRDREDSDDFSQIALQRMISQSLADLFLTGGAYLGATASASYPDVYLPALTGAQRAFQDAMRKFPDTGTFKIAYKNFLQRAVFEVWTLGEDELAAELHREWSTLLAENEPALTVAQLVCGTLSSLYGQGSQRFGSIPLIAQNQYEIWASRGQLARALRYQSIPLFCR